MSNEDKIKKRYETFLAKVAKEMQQELKTVSREQRDWGFDTQTKRKNGQVVGNPRNIVDQGTFVNGIQASGKTVSFNAPHSGLVIKGYRTKNGYVPPRDVISIARDKIKDSDKIQVILDGTPE